MSNQIMQEHTTTTVRRNYIGGVSPDQHKQLLSDGWFHDRLANQYRKIGRGEKLFVDGVEVEGVAVGDAQQATEQKAAA